ncbi:MAG: magnesium transporter CorA family protein, partial [Planctomycetes bacterium]|nr:magnesium transporter CorA family protein [Planctomycetota bacterium]
TLASALDPDELSRLEFEPEHVAMILKRPRNYSSEDNFLFKVVSTGFFLFKDRLLIVAADEPTFDGKPFLRLRSLPDLILRIIYRTIIHYEQHLRTINMISSELEQEINTAMENKHLLNLFALEKSLVYYLNAISSNAVLVEKLRNNAAKIGFTPENLELLDDIIIENNQCHGQAQIHSNILASLMDARASIVANNLNVLMKTLNIIMIALMLPTLVVSIFSMNVPIPLQKHDLAFWMIIVLAAVTALAVGLVWRYKRL